MTNDYSPGLVHLPGTKLTPDVVLHRTLNKLHAIKSVVIVIQWKDESFDVDWSQMKTTELCGASFVLDQTARDVFAGKVNDD